MAQRSDWWLASSNHVVTEQVPGPPAEVREFYCDLHNLTRLHPFVVSVHSTSRVEADHGYIQIYRIRDRIPFGPVTMGIAYTARVFVPASGDVRTEARQFPRVRLTGRVSFEQIGGGTRLVERLRIEAPRPLAAVTARQAVRAHVEMLAGLRTCF